MRHTVADAITDELVADAMARLGHPNADGDPDGGAEDQPLIPDDTAALARTIAIELERTQYAQKHRSTQTLAAGVLYTAAIATNAGLSADAIADRFGCTPDAIRATYANVAAVWLAASADRLRKQDRKREREGELADDSRRAPTLDDLHRSTVLDTQTVRGRLAEIAADADRGAAGEIDDDRGAGHPGKCPSCGQSIYGIVVASPDAEDARFSCGCPVPGAVQRDLRSPATGDDGDSGEDEEGPL